MEKLNESIKQLEQQQNERQGYLDKMEQVTQETLKTSQEMIEEVEQMLQEMKQLEQQRIENEKSKLKNLFGVEA